MAMVVRQDEEDVAPLRARAAAELERRFLGTEAQQRRGGGERRDKD
jgi:hypothetical protein